ncbi:hypothetical protein VPH35_024630 [Triticum aestivum]
MEVLFRIGRSGPGAPRNRKEKRQLQGLRDELDASLEEELQRRPEVRIINKYAVVMAYIRMGMKGVGALALLWATVVLLGGFVSDLRKIDFWYLTMIAFVQAAGLSDTMGDARLEFFRDWILSLISNVTSWGEKNHDQRTKLTTVQCLKREIHIIRSRIIDLTLVVIFGPVVYFAQSGPILCCLLADFRVQKQDYGITDGDASKANLKPALTLFYCVSLAQSAICLLCTIVEGIADRSFVDILCQQHGFSSEVLGAYLQKTKQMCINNPASTTSWNLITYGADMLDSQLAEDYAAGGRVLTMLIDLDTPVQIAWLLNRSPRQRIQKLIGTLAWRSPAEKEMRWLAARIVEHLAGDLNLAHFPGALECISSLFDTSCHNNADQEALHWTSEVDRSKQRKWTELQNRKIAGNQQKDKDGNQKVPDAISSRLIAIFLEQLHMIYDAMKNGGTLGQDSKQRENDIGTYEDLVLPGLRILKNLSHDRHNCTLIYNTKDLISKIIAPVNSNKLVQDIKSNTVWTKVVDVSLAVVGRLMCSSGSTGEAMRSLIADDTDAIKNLEAVLEMDTDRNNSVIELQMRVIEVLTQLALHHPASTSSIKRREKLIKRVLHIFITTNWMEDYLKDEKRKIDKPTTSQQKTLPRTPKGTCINDLVRTLSGAQTKGEMYRQAAEAREKRMKEAKETASRLKAKAGEALAMLSGDPEAIKNFTGCDDVVVHHLTQLLDSKNKTISCEISATDNPVQIEINIGCRISAAIILKHLRDYNKEPTLRQTVAQFDDFVVRFKKMVEDNMYATPACLAIHKLSCEMVIEFIRDDRNVEVIDRHNIVGTLLEASEMMTGLESSMLFAGVDRDCHGVPLKPLSSVLAKKAEDLLIQRKGELDIDAAPARAP